MNGLLKIKTLIVGVLLSVVPLSVLPVSAEVIGDASTEDVILLAECGGFFNTYGTLVGRTDLSSTGNRLAAKVLGRAQDTRSLAISYERGSEFADSWHDSDERTVVVDYIQMCSRVVSRNIDYLKAAT